MSDVSAGRARGAAETLIAVWRELGASSKDYELIWKAKEYLLDCADELERRQVLRDVLAVAEANNAKAMSVNPDTLEWLRGGPKP
jgi:predicted metal-dependent hydrolase